VKAGGIDAIVVYKLDRLTRSITDLNDIVLLLNAKNVALVSIEVIKHMRELRARGKSYRAIAAELNAARLPTKRNGKWQPMTVRNIPVRA